LDFCLKINHLATLAMTEKERKKTRKNFCAMSARSLQLKTEGRGFKTQSIAFLKDWPPTIYFLILFC
jgi:hypothetical protein